MKYFFSTFIFIFSFQLLRYDSASAQGSSTSSIHSLEKFVDAQNNDTARIDMLIELSQKYMDNEPDKAFDFGFKALLLASHLDFQHGIGKAHNNLGDLYWYANDFISSSDHYTKALEIYENIDDKAQIASCYRNIGWIYFNDKKLNDVINSYTIALDINKSLGRYTEICQNYNDLGIVYVNLKNYNAALNFYCRAVEVADSIENKVRLAATYGNIAAMYQLLENTEDAIRYWSLSIKYSNEIGNSLYNAGSYNELAKCYLKVDSVKKAFAYADSAKSFAKQIKNLNLLKAVYQNYSEIYSDQKNYLKALEYNDSVANTIDLIKNETNQRQTLEMRSRFESDKKIRAINDLETDKEIAEEKLENEKKTITYLISFCLMIVAFAIVLVINNRQKRKANREIETALKEVEEKNKNITDSINYAKHIQDVSLPGSELRQQLFGDSFIFFKPKDIVSGDFYWYSLKDGKRIIACCDCTGHGVPGALMSMIGGSILNKIVNENGITSPDEILFNLNIEIRKTLKQEDALVDSVDGMDCSIICFNEVNSKGDVNIQYSGANLPVYIIKNKANPTQSNLIELKADKRSIGGSRAETKKIFHKNELVIEKGDNVYLFTDGYIDQFGKSDRKRFTSKRLKEVLLLHSQQPMDEQFLVVEKELNNWQEDAEQIDDILVIGIKI